MASPGQLLCPTCRIAESLSALTPADGADQCPMGMPRVASLEGRAVIPSCWQGNGPQLCPLRSHSQLSSWGVVLPHSGLSSGRSSVSRIQFSQAGRLLHGSRARPTRSRDRRPGRLSFWDRPFFFSQGVSRPHTSVDKHTGRPENTITQSRERVENSSAIHVLPRRPLALLHARPAAADLHLCNGGPRHSFCGGTGHRTDIQAAVAAIRWWCCFTRTIRRSTSHPRYAIHLAPATIRRRTGSTATKRTTCRCCRNNDSNNNPNEREVQVPHELTHINTARRT